MKARIITASVALFASSAALAAYTGPLVVKSSGSGFAPADMVRSETCELYADKVVITKYFGQTQTIAETRPLAITGNLLAIADRSAAETALQTPNNLCDGPETTISAVQVLANGTTATVTLYTTGGCSSPTIERNGPASQILRDMVGAFCPQTYKGIGQ